MNEYVIMGVGFLAQLLFTSRVLVQWILSEKAKKVLSPTIFWNLSLLGSFVMICYGILRQDAVIIGGQFLGYFIYIRNLQLKKFWPRLPLPVRILVMALPIAVIIWLFTAENYSFNTIVNNPDIAGWMLAIGVPGFIIFTSRFLYQLYYSERKGESTLPVGFWLISMVGSSLIFTYAIVRQDFPVMLGHTFGLVVYVRNIFLYYNRGKRLRGIRSEREANQSS